MSVQTQIKLLKKGIRINGQYFKAHYSESKSHIHGKATIYLWDYEKLPEMDVSGLSVPDDSDSLTDYFPKPKIELSPDCEYFDQVEKLAEVR